MEHSRLLRIVRFLDAMLCYANNAEGTKNKFSASVGRTRGQEIVSVVVVVVVLIDILIF